ncbi:MAG: transcription termination factor NusA [Anaerovoracaceae bacterium]|jgi:N utilization substance protein A
MNEQFIEAIEQVEQEKGIPREVLFDAIEQALLSAYKKNYGKDSNVDVEIDPEEGDINVYMRMDVVDEVEDVNTEISLAEAQEIDPAYEVGDVVEYQVKPDDFSRIAAQTAKQVIVQRIREAERGIIVEDFKDKIGEIVTGKVSRIIGQNIFVSLGRAEGKLALREQIKGERFRPQDRIKVYVKEVRSSSRGPEIVLSRACPEFVEKLFEQEVPEIEDGIVEIKSIAREAGSRTKMTVWTNDEDVDPVGACVGSRGSRVQAVVDELGNEKIDIINWSEDPFELIANVLSPAKVESVALDETDDEKIATVVVPDYQLSLAIGKSGQNVRLAAKISGWKIDIKSHTQMEEMQAEGTIIEEGEEMQEAPEEIDAEEAAEAAEMPAEETDEAAEEAAEEETAEETEAAEEPAEEMDEEAEETAEEAEETEEK